jgi:hypothetical protein
MTMRLFIAAILLPAIVLVGCAPNSGAPRTTAFDPDLDRPGPDAPWPFWPSHMRVHPLTRIIEDAEAGERILEARIEFTDRDGYSSRAYGFLRIELFDGDPAIGRADLTGWNVDLRDLDRNENHFDDVSRMYLMRLELGQTPTPAEPVLNVEFYSLNGTDVQVTHRIRR